MAHYNPEEKAMWVTRTQDWWILVRVMGRSSSLKLSSKRVINQRPSSPSWAYALQALHVRHPGKSEEESLLAGAGPFHMWEIGGVSLVDVGCEPWQEHPFTPYCGLVCCEGPPGSGLDMSFSGHWSLSPIHNKLFCRQKACRGGGRGRRWLAANSPHLERV